MRARHEAELPPPPSPIQGPHRPLNLIARATRPEPQTWIDVILLRRLRPTSHRRCPTRCCRRLSQSIPHRGCEGWTIPMPPSECPSRRTRRLMSTCARPHRRRPPPHRLPQQPPRPPPAEHASRRAARQREQPGTRHHAAVCWASWAGSLPDHRRSVSTRGDRCVAAWDERSSSKRRGVRLMSARMAAARRLREQRAPQHCRCRSLVQAAAATGATGEESDPRAMVPHPVRWRRRSR